MMWLKLVIKFHSQRDAPCSCHLLLACRKAGATQSSMRSAMLFTHRGFSGPAPLDLSHNFTRPMQRGRNPSQLPRLTANWVGLPREQWESLLQPKGTETVGGALRRGGVPARLAEALCQELGLGALRVAQLKREHRVQLLEALTAYQLECTGHEGYSKVCSGDHVVQSQPWGACDAGIAEAVSPYVTFDA